MSQNYADQYKDAANDPESSQVDEAENISPAIPVGCAFGAEFNADPNHDLAAVERSRAALSRYRQEYRQLDAWPYPLRVRLARHAGLPAMIKGYLGSPARIEGEESLKKLAAQVLYQPSTAEILFGLAGDEVGRRLAYTGFSQLSEPNGEYPAIVKEGVETGKMLFHVRCQQYQHGLPVYGAQVVLHLAMDDPRLAVTSSYFPLKENATFENPVNEQVAVGQARTAALQRILLKDPNVKWEAFPVPYEKSLIFVLPFIENLQDKNVGRYVLAYQFEVISSAEDQAWRVYVDANLGTVLGEPQSLVAGVGVFNNSTALLNNQPTSISAQDLIDLTGQNTLSGNNPLPPIDQLIDWNFHPDADSNRGAIDFSVGAINTAETTLTNVNASQAEQKKATATLEAVSIATHARKIYPYFVNVCGAMPQGIQTYQSANGATKLHIRVGRAVPVLAMGFIHSDRLPITITFQTDPGAGLDAGNNKNVFKPSFDPEVIFHELTHALMWLVNRAPYEQKNDNVPFGRALIEGYANYFARSYFARPVNDPATALGEPWARGAYHTDSQEWGDEWALGKDSSRAVANLLSPPNIYPVPVTTENAIAVYDVGMIWARALWQVRRLFEALPNGLDLVDHLALESYQYVHGWVTNFEMAAEGLIDAVIKRAIPGMVNPIIEVFRRRGILAERGVQALAAGRDDANNLLVLVGSDQGVWRYTHAAGNPWQRWGDLRDVVGIAVDGNAVYAATVQGVFRFDAPNNAWIAMGAWPTGETALSIKVSINNLFAGTANGVWRLRTDALAGTAWQQWKSGGISWRMTDDFVNGVPQGDRLCFISNLTSQPVMALFSEAIPASWPDLGLISPGAMLVDLSVIADDIFAATAHHGIWRRQGVTYIPGDRRVMNGLPWVSEQTNAFASKGLICLGLDQRGGGPVLLAGASDGLYRRDPALGWSRIVEIPPEDQVSGILSAPPLLVVGTTNQKVWINEATGWHAFALP